MEQVSHRCHTRQASPREVGRTEGVLQAALGRVVVVADVLGDVEWPLVGDHDRDRLTAAELRTALSPTDLSGVGEVALVPGDGEAKISSTIEPTWASVAAFLLVLYGPLPVPWRPSR